MSIVTISVVEICGIDRAHGANDRLSICVNMTDGQCREAVTEILGNMTESKISEFLRDEYPQLFKEEA
jgi:hypothetical protein